MSFVDSICIKFLQPKLVIYGKGNQLVIQNDRIKQVHDIRPYDKVHKISYLEENDNTFRIACSAGREILVTKVSSQKFQGGFKSKFNDWISSIRYLSNGLIAIITSHNIAALLEIDNNELIMREKVKCDNNSTLYCSYIHGNLWTDLIFFSGTALGELIVWNNKAETVFQESTHNGVIFSIYYNENYIVTSSDDRSIKVYKAKDDFSQLKQLKQLFGHTSRVFVAKIIKYKDEVKYLSAGEDANLCIWNENGTLQAKKNVNASGGIWDLDYDAENGIIVTSSSTGKLNKFHLHKMFYELHEKEMISAVESIEPSKLLYLQNGTLCVLDNNMQLFTKNTAWTRVNQPQNVHKIVGMNSIDNRLFLAAKNSILIYDFSSSSKTLNFTMELNMDEKFSKLLPKTSYFRDIHALSRNNVFLSDVNGSCIVIDVENEIVRNLFKIPKSSEPWSTSVAQIDDDYWIIADRLGSLYLYRHAEHASSSTFLDPIQRVSRLHGQSGVTSIRLLADDFIKTTGIDGTIKTLRLNRQNSKLEFYQLERTTHVQFIEKAREYDGKCYIHGFNDNYFVLYKDREIIYEHKCGGRHRHWDVTLIDRDDLKLEFAYIYKKQVHCVKFLLNDFIFDPRADNFFWHIKQCNVIQVIDDILISGSEDTVLKLTRIESVENDISYRKMADINSHISSIKAIVTWRQHDVSNELFIMSMGGRAQIVVTRLIGMRYVKEEINFMLTNSMMCGYSKESTFDPETRFTCAYFDTKRSFLFVGCSDGYLRVFRLINNEFSSSLMPVIERFYGRCILHITVIKSFILTMSTDGIVCFWRFCESTDGLYELETSYKLHHNQNGINCFDVFQLDDRYRIATAGDDSGIFVTDFEIIESMIKCYETIKTYDVHTAQVTGIQFIAHDELLTSSVDQTLCKVKINADKLVVFDKRFTCISDVKGFSIFDNKLIFVYGAGLEAIKYF